MRSPDRITVVANVLLYQAGWLACVLGAAHGWPWAGVVVAVAVVGWHLAKASSALPEARLVALATIVGAVFETLLVRTGWLRFPNGMLVEGTAPYWMVTLWAEFATTLNVSLRWLREKPLVAAAFGAIGGPLAYAAGAKLGAIEFVRETPALVAIAVGWAAVTPALFAAARRLDGFRAT